MGGGADYEAGANQVLTRFEVTRVLAVEDEQSRKSRLAMDRFVDMARAAEGMEPLSRKPSGLARRMERYITAWCPGVQRACFVEQDLDGNGPYCAGRRAATHTELWSGEFEPPSLSAYEACLQEDYNAGRDLF